jgi:F-type H+-transporting ATPase subunit a
MAAGLHVSISAEPIAEVFGFSITNSIFTSLIVSTLLILFAIIFRSRLKQTNRPTGVQNVVELIIESLYNFVHSITENTARTKLFFPIIATFFIFIILNNYIGLLPGVGSIMVPKAVEAAHAAEAAEAGHSLTPIFRAATADLNTTLALALISVVLTQIYGVSHLGLAYFKKFFNFSNVLQAFVGFLELISEFAKIISFAFRLFGNIFAGEVLLSVMTYLVKVIVPSPFYALELFVGFIQALVFSMLSLIFFNMATKHHEE